jgi:uracil-DNA glycosylase family 4
MKGFRLNCNKCPNVINHINPEILTGSNSILIVGESPKGQLIDCLNTPTFKRLTQNLAEQNIKFSECSFTEICKCELQNRSDLYIAGRRCMPRLAKQISDTKPRLVITLGVIANRIFAEQYNVEPGVGKLVKLPDFEYLPLWHTSPINPRGFKKNQQILADKTLTSAQK